MFINFFLELRKAKVPVTLREHLMLMEGMAKQVAMFKVDDFYYLSRSALVKDERNLDKFDRVFGKVFKGIEYLSDVQLIDLPEEWLKMLSEQVLSAEELAEIEKMGGIEALLEMIQQRLEEQQRGEGDDEDGRNGTGAEGDDNKGEQENDNPNGERVGRKKRGQGKALKVWNKREYKNLDDEVELGTRNIKIALRRLRKFAREGAEIELDMPDTIKSTAHNAGILDIKMVAERHNKVKVLLCFDIGGSMDAHVRTCEELFSATRTEFKHMEYYYFHNCPYEAMWKDNRRRHSEKVNTYEILRTFPPDYKLIFVGDATMSPYEIMYPGGSVEHWNEEAGEVWIQRMIETYQAAVWINPVPEKHWEYSPSTQVVKQLLSNRMFPLTLSGIDAAMKELNR